MGIGMPGLGPYNPEMEPRKESRRGRLGWGDRSFSTANMLQTSGRTISWGMFEGACGDLLVERKKEKHKQKKEKKKKKAALAAAGCCGQALRELCHCCGSISRQHERSFLPTVRRQDRTR